MARAVRKSIRLCRRIRGSKAAVSPIATRLASSASGASDRGAVQRVVFVRGIGCRGSAPRSGFVTRNWPYGFTSFFTREPDRVVRPRKFNLRSGHAQPVPLGKTKHRKARVHAREFLEPVVAS